MDVAATTGMDVIIEEIRLFVIFCYVFLFSAMGEEIVEIVIFFNNREALVNSDLVLIIFQIEAFNILTVIFSLLSKFIFIHISII